jgi:hypothetical protein
MDTEHASENPGGPESLLDVSELAAYLGVPVSTVYDWRTNPGLEPAERGGLDRCGMRNSGGPRTPAPSARWSWRSRGLWRSEAWASLQPDEACG